MDILKALRTTTIISAVALSALGGTAAYALDQTAVISNASASVVGALAVTEISSINFGNIFINGACTVATDVPLAGAAPNTTDYVQLSDEGTRTPAGCITLMYGASQSGKSNVSGNFETGGQVPGFYNIVTDNGTTNIYVSFADINGDIVDSAYGSDGNGTPTWTHPNNYVTLTGPAANTFAMNQFTFETDKGTAGNGTSGYTQLDPAAWDATNHSGNYVPCAGTCTLRVGATLIPLEASPPKGKYVGQFYVMVSY